MLGKGLYRKFINNWADRVTLILKVAGKNENSKVKKVLNFYKKTDIRDSFGISNCNWCKNFTFILILMSHTDTRSCAAIELLPLLLPVRNKKGVNPVDYLYYVKEVSD